jgi:ketosteroid isomerase-like protein
MDPATERLIRQGYAAFARGDLAALRRAFHPDAEYVNPPYAIDGGTRRGVKELSGIWRSLHELFEIDSVQVDELREGPRGVFVMTRTRGRGRGSGVPSDVSQAHVLEVRDRRIVRLAWFATREEGLAAAGLS